MNQKILHVINSMGIGGAEKLLVDTLPIYKIHFCESQVDLLLLNGKSTFFMDSLKLNFTGKIYCLGNGSVYNILHIFKMFKYINNYDVIHVHLFPSLYFVSIAKFLLNSKVKLIFTEHSTSNTRAESALFRFIDRIIYKNYSLITAISPQVKDMLVSKLKLKNKIEVIYNGIDLNKFILAKSNRVYCFFQGDNSRILIQVSRFSIQKDQETVIRAMCHLPSEVKLVLVGDGEFKIVCEQLVVKLGLRNRVLFLGARGDIPDLLNSSDIVIQSSVWEGFGIAAVEGMAAGKPVISSDVPGLKDIVEGAGLLFKKGDEVELSNLIKDLLWDKIYYDKIASDCLQKSQQFDITAMTKKFINIYENI